MSDDPEQEYFSDGITEDIITDLSKVSALEVVSRNGSFLYKGKQIDIPRVARELEVTHVLEGSVRRAAGRVRITAQLIDGTRNRHIWAERYDRDASDIFAIQDEISHAIVKALKLRLLPEEKKAIERRGTDSADAHELYLMARQIYATSPQDAHAWQAVARMCMRATRIDPDYAQAWALRAAGEQMLLELGAGSEDGMLAADKALELAPDLAEAHAVKARILLVGGDPDAAAAEAARALELDPESHEANRAAARLNYQLKHYEEAGRLYEKATALMDADVNSAAMLVSCYTAMGDGPARQRAAEMALKRADAALARDPYNVGVLAYSVSALVALSDAERAKARMHRAMLIDPDNFDARYNFACVLSAQLKDSDAALEMLGPTFKTITAAFLPYAIADSDFDFVRDDPRFKAMVAEAEARLATEKSAAPTAARRD
jgi:adenylate cyclase